MTEEQLKNLLFKMSAMAIHSISEGSTDFTLVQEAIERNSSTHPVIFSTQILNVKNGSDGEKEITFSLSPEFLKTNSSLVNFYSLRELSWIYKLPKYNYGTEEVLMEDDEGQISMRSEEGVVNWLIQGTIELIKVNPLTYELNLETLYHSVMNTNNN